MIYFLIFLQFPSVYSKTRRRALEHTLDRFHNDKYPNVPYFLFGDFNFRTDTASVIKVRLISNYDIYQWKENIERKSKEEIKHAFAFALYKLICAISHNISQLN